MRTRQLAVGLGLWAIGLAVAAASAAGQDVPTTIAHDLRDGAHDMLRIWASPFHTDADDLPAIGATAAGAVLVYLVDRPVQDWVRDHQRSAAVRAIAPFRKGHPFEKAGFAGPILIGSAGLYAAGLIFDERSLREAGLGCAAAVEAGSLARHVVYYTVSRGRPSVTDDPGDWSLGHGDWDHRSFFAGHGANLMTCSTFLASRFHLGVAEPVLYAAAAGVALGRIADLAHWPSDTFVSLVVGYAIGRLEADRVAGRAAGASANEAGARLVPAAVEGLRVAPAPGGGLLVTVGLRH